MKVAIVGAGSWGTAVAALVSENTDVALWARRPELARTMAEERENPEYLPGRRLAEGIRVTSDLQEAVDGASVVVMAVPSHGYRDVLGQVAADIPADIPLVSLTKGVERGTLKRMTEVTAEVLDGHRVDRIGVLSGPNLACEVAAGQPAATVVAMADEATARQLQTVFMTPRFRVYTNPDVVGCETAGALKNVMAIGTGMAAGLGYGDNSRAALITRGLAELTRLGVALGGNRLTFLGLAGIGDLVATCSSEQSRNRTVGFQLGKGRKLDEIVAEMKMVAEGVKTTEAVLELAERHGVDVPIAATVGAVLYEGMEPSDMVSELMTREAKAELHGIE